MHVSVDASVAQADAAKKKKKKRKKEGGDGGLGGSPAASSPAEMGSSGLGRSPDVMHNKKKAKVEGASGPRSPDFGGGGSGNPGDSSSMRNGDVSGGSPAMPPEERHEKYDPHARAPWKGGEVKPYLYGRKVVLKLGGKRLPPIWR